MEWPLLALPGPTQPRQPLRPRGCAPANRAAAGNVQPRGRLEPSSLQRRVRRRHLLADWGANWGTWATERLPRPNQHERVPARRREEWSAERDGMILEPVALETRRRFPMVTRSRTTRFPAERSPSRGTIPEGATHWGSPFQAAGLCLQQGRQGHRRSPALLPGPATSPLPGGAARLGSKLRRWGATRRTALAPLAAPTAPTSGFRLDSRSSLQFPTHPRGRTSREVAVCVCSWSTRSVATGRPGGQPVRAFSLCRAAHANAKSSASAKAVPKL